MKHSNAPVRVREWIASPPDWASIQKPKHEYLPKRSGLGIGEIAAIALAIEENADAVLMDDRAGILEGRNANLTVLTTFAVFEIAAMRNLIDFEEMLNLLSKTTFRMPPATIVADYLRRNAERKAT
ncbi:MAG: hypothetical protein WBD16_06720 [Pyrinomonadaceae bacterium]